MTSTSKGITPVIAVILLLLITISMVGFAFVWFGRVQTQLQNSTQERINRVVGQQEQTIRIDGINSGAGQVYIRSTGSQTIPVSGLQVYLNNALVSGACTTSLAPGATITCELGVSPCTAGSRVRVSAPGNIDEADCA